MNCSWGHSSLFLASTQRPRTHHDQHLAHPEPPNSCECHLRNQDHYQYCWKLCFSFNCAGLNGWSYWRLRLAKALGNGHAPRQMQMSSEAWMGLLHAFAFKIKAFLSTEKSLASTALSCRWNIRGPMVFTNRDRRALQGQPEPPIHSFCFPVPLTLVQIQVGSLRRTPATWQCHRFHGVLQDGYLSYFLLQHSVAAKLFSSLLFISQLVLIPAPMVSLAEFFLELARQKKFVD